MKKTLLILALAVFSVLTITGCKVQMSTLKTSFDNVVLSRKPQNSYNNLLNGIETHVEVDPPIGENSINVFHINERNIFSSPTIKYVRSMGLVEKSPTTDYRLEIVVEKADFVTSKSEPEKVDVELSVSLRNAQEKLVYSQKNVTASVNQFEISETDHRDYVMSIYSFLLDEAYTQALEQINWNRIASFLRTEQLPKDEPDKQVQGLGDTALEQTIIRWDIQSRPQGADIFWRVVSKTPDVKSTNNKYLMTTPYEATKALDIKGLTYQTSGNVRIILRCEKDGYMSQEKEFDVRMVLDQEEISAFFRLVKEE